VAEELDGDRGEHLVELEDAAVAGVGVDDQLGEPWTISLILRGGTAMSLASRYRLMPIGLKNSSRRTSPGCTGASRLPIVSPLSESQRSRGRGPWEGVNSFQCPSETTATVPSTTMRAVSSSIA
jgi:hypothetical protein